MAIKTYKDKDFKVSIVGDVHIMERSPRYRKDDYLNSILSKLDYIFDNSDIVLFLGDLFDNPTISYKAFHRFVSLLKHHYVNGKQFYSIVGNHDIQNYNLHKLKESTLGLIFSIGLIKPLTRISVNGIIFDGMTLGNKVIEQSSFDLTNTSFLLGHYFYNNSLDPDYSITDDQIINMNYDYLFLGHDHKPYSVKTIGKTLLHRGGSICRNTIDDFNLKRVPSFYQVYIKPNSDYEINYLEIKSSLLTSEVYIPEVFQTNTSKINKEYLTDISSVLKSFTKNVNLNSNNISSILLSLNPPDEVYHYIENTYLENNMKFL